MPAPGGKRDLIRPFMLGTAGSHTRRWGIARYLSLPDRERRFFRRAVSVLALVRIMLWVVPLRTALRVTCRVRDRRGGARAEGPGVQELAQAVRRASRVVPRANCLPQALACQILLGRAGHESEMRIGVRHDPERGFEAHAWLEHRREVVLGELPEMARFSPMPALDRYLGRHVPR